jgi:HAD superfamily hydrolase (TIGR01509 family)
VIEALLWDVDGTLAETERDGHRLAFNDAFAALGLAWRWDEARYGELLRITGGRERILFDLSTQPGAPATPAGREALARELHQCKNKAYEQRMLEGAITLRPGVPELLDEAAACGLRQAIVTTTSRANLMALLDHTLGRGARTCFHATVCGEDVAGKKPDPEAYHRALQQLGLPPQATLALEDSPAGVAAACGARVPVVVTRSAYFAQDAVPGALAVGPGLHTRLGWCPALPASGGDRRVALDDLFEWHARRGAVPRSGADRSDRD